jgi:hypothetical protein
MDYYFAYGSNLDQQRMKDRKIKIYTIVSAWLLNYELKFNKISKKQGAVANIMLKAGSIVEGVLYQIEDIKTIDIYEGYPKHYNRIQMSFNIDNKDVLAWIYIAQPHYIKEGLKPKQEYLNHILKGKSYMTPEYYENLKNIRN